MSVHFFCERGEMRVREEGGWGRGGKMLGPPLPLLAQA